MKKVLYLLLATLLLASCTSVNTDVGKIEITGSGSVTANPDIAEFSISMNTLKETTSEAVNELKALQSQVLKVLVDDCKINEDDIVSTYLNFSPSYSWVDGKQVLNGQQASATYSVTLRALDQIGSVYDKLSAISTISLSDINLKVEDNSEYVAEARVKAVENAIATATLYAESLGCELGEVVYVSEGSSSTTFYDRVAVAPKAMAVNAESLDYRQDDIKISAKVNVIFTLK